MRKGGAPHHPLHGGAVIVMLLTDVGVVCGPWSWHEQGLEVTDAMFFRPTGQWSVDYNGLWHVVVICSLWNHMLVALEFGTWGEPSVCEGNDDRQRSTRRHRGAVASPPVRRTPSRKTVGDMPKRK
jgi:hypothetical protein